MFYEIVLYVSEWGSLIYTFMTELAQRRSDNGGPTVHNMNFIFDAC